MSESLARSLLDTVGIVPLLPLFGAALLMLFGKRIGEPIAGWIATGLMGGAFVWSLVMFASMLSLPDDARSNTHPTNIPATCARCHEDAAMMGKYRLPTDQFTRFRRSAHGIALFDEQNFASPSCVGCHGTHSALPPSVTEIANVCGRCHVLVSQSFDAGPHAQAARPASPSRSAAADTPATPPPRGATRDRPSTRARSAGARCPAGCRGRTRPPGNRAMQGRGISRSHLLRASRQAFNRCRPRRTQVFTVPSGWRR